MELININWQPSANYKVHQCEYCPKDCAVLVWPEEDLACLAKVYHHLPEQFQCDNPVYEYMTLPSEDRTVYYCPWCGEELLNERNYGA